MAESSASRKATDEELDQFFETVMTCDPVFDPGDAEGLADLVFSKDKLIRNWRWAAYVGGKSGAYFLDIATNPDKARPAAATILPLQGFAELLRAMANAADCVAARLQVAGCNHQDFDAWMKEADEAGEAGHV